ncbi:MAG: cytochrome C [Nitrospinota bacterium]|nr:MAG: cytochrome C [Nitrospinota bacterium]
MAQEASAVQRGEYLFRASGGCGCHTDPKKGAFLAGGRPLKTPFGVVYSTNITPDPVTGIGRWSDADFIRAMTEGKGPDGKHYFPVFPYTSFTRMTRQDLLDLKAYLFSVPPIRQENRAPELIPPLGWRPALRGWKWLYFRPGPFQPDPRRSAEWNRGAYLVTALGHCGECHTPRNFLGGPKEELFLAGSVDGPEGQLAPNITPDEATGIGTWSIPDIVWFLQTGFKPDGDDAQGLMAEMIEQGYRHLSEADLTAIAVYLRSLPPIRHKVLAK